MRRLVAAVLIVAFAGCVTTGSPDAAKVAQGYYDRGISHLQQKDYEKAIVEFQRSIKTDPKNKLSYYALGIVNDMMGKYADAERFYKDAIGIDSEFSEAYNALGVIYTKQQRWKDALKSFQRALDNKLYATPHVPYLNMGDVHMAQLDYPKAIESYQESKRLVNQDITVYKLGTALVAAGKVRAGIMEFQEGVAMAPRNPDMRMALALAFLKEGDKRSALSEFRKVVELAPTSEAARSAKDYIATLDTNSVQPKKKK